MRSLAGLGVVVCGVFLFSCMFRNLSTLEAHGPFLPFLSEVIAAALCIVGCAIIYTDRIESRP